MDVNSITRFNNYNTKENYYTNNDYDSSSILSDIENIGVKSNLSNLEAKEKLDDSYDKKELDKSLKKLNKFLEDENVRAEYSVHEDLGTLMIKIIDEDKNKVVLEIPPEKILDMVASLCKQMGIIDKKV